MKRRLKYHDRNFPSKCKYHNCDASYERNIGVIKHMKKLHPDIDFLKIQGITNEMSYRTRRKILEIARKKEKAVLSNAFVAVYQTKKYYINHILFS